ncbi:MAG: sulfite oxidase [Chloroflexi bacterium]|nr:sulfite oxidase [Chloroflexota bacterium]
MEPRRDPRLIAVSDDPFNAETPLSQQVGVITPAPLHYVRSHFPIPRWDRLVVDGLVEHPLSLGIEDVLAMPSRSLVVTLECAGNGRQFLDPPVAGEQWGLGAVGTAEWTGVELRHIVGLARLDPRATEIVFAGADHGVAAGRRLAYERSLPVDEALDDDVLVAFGMNGEPLPADHGAPLRLVVPGSYGMASVKWVARIGAVDRPFRGHFQADRYIIDGKPLPPVAPRAVITSPADGAVVSGHIVVRGYCWSGGSPVARVELSSDGGRTWSDAEVQPPVSPYAWRRWSAEWSPRGPGDAVLVARAWTRDGGAQPMKQRATGHLGYMNNAAQPITVKVGAAT